MQNTQAPAAPPEPDPGFKLPSELAPPSPQADVMPKATTAIEVAPALDEPVTDTSTRDLAIGGGAFLILLIIYFFVRSAYVHHLVVRRVAPSAAGSAGWLLFVGLAFVSAATVLAVINASKFLTVAVTTPLVVVGVIALVAAVFVGRR